MVALSEPTGQDSFLALAVIVAAEIYGESLPILALEHEALAEMQTGQWLEIRSDPIGGAPA